MHRSFDGGTSFALPTRFDLYGVNVMVRGAGNDVHVLWNEDNGDLRSAHSTDGGATWPDVDESVPATGVNPDGVCAVGADLHVAFALPGVPYFDAFVARRTSGLWGVGPQLNRAPPGGTAAEPSLAADAGNIFAVWGDYDAGTSSQRFVWSEDGGATWSPDVLKIDGGVGSGGAPKLCADGSYVYAVWRGSGSATPPWYVAASRP